MRRPYHFETVLPSRNMTPRTVAAVAGVGLIHLLFVYGLFSGLAARIVQTLPNVLDVHVFETAQPVRTELPPPVLPDLVQPSIDLVPPPEIHIAAPAAPDAITVLHKTPETPTRAASSVVAPAKAPAVPAPEPARSIAATHTIPPYPPLSRRLGEEGTVQLRIAIATDGRVERAIVESTSGSERLDDAAREWVAKHWRYHPATRDGRPVASETQVKVVFNLKTSR